MKTKEKTGNKIFSTNVIAIPCLFFVASIVLDLANLMHMKLGGGGTLFIPNYFLFDFAVVFMLSALIFAFQNKIAMCVGFCILLAVQTVMGIVNCTMFGLFGEVFSFCQLKLSKEAMAAFSLNMVDWQGFGLNISIFLFFTFIAIFLTVCNKTGIALKRKKAFFVVCAAFVLMQGLGVGVFEFQVNSLQQAMAEESEILSSDVYLWENFQFKTEAYKKFGYFGFYCKDILNNFFSGGLKEEEKEQYIQYIDNGHVQGNTNAALYNDNLIVILLESADMFAIDPYYTPTLWKMWNGYHTMTLKNFYGRNRTNYSEGAVLLGGMPREISLKNILKKGYKFQYSLPNLFKASGNENVVTNYMHANWQAFYDRGDTFGVNGLGFDNLYTWDNYNKANKPQFEWADWTMDEDFFEYFADDFLPTDKRFLSVFATMSTHGGWDNQKTHFEKYYNLYDQYEQKYKSWLAENNFVVPQDAETLNLLRNFKVATIDMDRTVAAIVKQLEDKGLDKNTSILMYADHNSYINDLAYKMRKTNDTDLDNPSYNHIPAMFYSPKLFDEKGKTINAFCNTYDLLPTLCELYGMPSNKNTFFGYSVLSPQIENSFFVSHSGGMITDKMYSKNISHVVPVVTVLNSEIEKFKNDALRSFEKIKIMETIYSKGINGTKMKIAT